MNSKICTTAERLKNLEEVCADFP
jgi:hypothetical protein